MDDQSTEWTRRARCRGLDPEQFFVRSLQQAKSAIRVCQRCPVRQDCLDYAVDEAIEVGVWGGLTERQRRAYARRRLTEAVR